MQKILIAAMAVVLFSCHAEDKKPADTTPGSKTETAGNLPYTATYSSKFEMGDPKHVETIMKLWKSWDDGDISKDSSLFADTIYIYSRDGSKAEGPKDSVNAGAQAYRNMFSSVKSTIHAIFPVKSTDKNESWVCVWGTEVSTDKQGKTDSVGLQEAWRFNKNGKVDLMYQHAKPLVPPPASK
ncbi:MAG: hypothetical protein JNK14_17875 [Chitinophagaceae bacterium]|nr:hypothetical protein [Chitinophagaceae bacterium]